MVILAHLLQLKRGLRLAIGVHFLNDFSITFPYLILYQLAKLQCHNFFPSQDIKQNVTKVLFRHLTLA